MIHLDADIRNADWTKTTLDLQVGNADELRVYLAGRGISLTQFKRLPVYKLALASGNYPWLERL